ncbi:hypothetical protein F4808DRAFT_445736 [Astrocystis sublimbata]|nr:hypothetical protein F4808DRAFT_445736 [Astrocystis sublimbata]
MAFATSNHPQASPDKMSNKQAAEPHHNEPEMKTKARHSVLRPSYVATWPFHQIKQALLDYQNGREIRKRTLAQEPENETDKKHETPASATTPSTPRKPPQQYKPQRSNSMRSEIGEHWVHQAGEWPWRKGLVTQWDPDKDWRIIEVWEVKDAVYEEMRALEQMTPVEIVAYNRAKDKRDDIYGVYEKERDELFEFLTRP